MAKGDKIKDPLGYLSSDKEIPKDPDTLTEEQIIEACRKHPRVRPNFVAVVPARVSVVEGNTQIMKTPAAIKAEQEKVMEVPCLVVSVHESVDDIKIGSHVLISKHSVPEAMLNIDNNYQLRYYNIHQIVGVR